MRRRGVIAKLRLLPVLHLTLRTVPFPAICGLWSIVIRCATCIHAHQLCASETNLGQPTRSQQVDLYLLLVREVLITLFSHGLKHLLHASLTLGILDEVLGDWEVPLVVRHRLVALLKSANNLRSFHVSDVH